MLTCPLPGLAARCKSIPSQSTSSSWLEDSSTGSTYAFSRFPILFGVANPRSRSSQVLDSQNRPCLTERALLSNLTAILSDANRTPQNQVAQSALGVLSTERRAIWAGHRERLSKDPGNSMCLDVLDKALFVVCLDDANPETASEQCANMLCGTYKLDKGVQVGTCTNRYYDKVCSLLPCRPDLELTYRPHSFKSSSQPTEPLESTLSTLESTVTLYFGMISLIASRRFLALTDSTPLAASSPTSTPSSFSDSPSPSTRPLLLSSRPRFRHGPRERARRLHLPTEPQASRTRRSTR